MSNIIERFITEVDQFHSEDKRLTEWLENNEQDIQQPLQLATLNADNDKLKTILNEAIRSQTDLQSLQDHLQHIDSTIKDFEQATGNTDGGKSANIYKQLQQRMETLSHDHSDFLKRSKHVSDQCERYMITYDEINHLNEEIVKSIKEFDQNLTTDGNQQQASTIAPSQSPTCASSLV